MVLLEDGVPEEGVDPLVAQVSGSGQPLKDLHQLAHVLLLQRVSHPKLNACKRKICTALVFVFGLHFEKVSANSQV